MKTIPTLRQLRYLVAVVDHCHFGHAAESCLIGQSTLSAAIQELEELFGAPLLERTKRSVVPTPLGRDIAGRARSLLRDAEGLMEFAQTARDPMAGPFHLGVIPTISPFLLPRIIPPLRSRFPTLKLFLREDQTARLLESLNNGTLDAVVLARPWPSHDLESLPIAEDPFWVVCPSGHRLAGLEQALPDQVAAEDLLLLEDGHCLRDHALSACGIEGARRDTAFQGTSLHTLTQMVANGLGVTLLPQMALKAGILGGLDLIAVPLAGDAAYREITLVWRPTSGRKEACRRIGALLQEVTTDHQKAA